MLQKGRIKSAIVLLDFFFLSLFAVKNCVQLSNKIPQIKKKMFATSYNKATKTCVWRCLNCAFIFSSASATEDKLSFLILVLSWLIRDEVQSIRSLSFSLLG